jgi:hypothetical protein
VYVFQIWKNAYGILMQAIIYLVYRELTFTDSSQNIGNGKIGQRIVNWGEFAISIGLFP